jgi:hypothetical protein
MVWNGSMWVPTSIASAVTSVSAGAGGSLIISPTTGAVVAERAALTGDVTAAQDSNATTVVAIQGIPWESGTPGDGSIPFAKSGQWFFDPFGGDISGDPNVVTVVGIDGIPITAPYGISQILVSNSSATGLVPTTPNASGDVSGGIGDQTVIGLQGLALSPAAPMSGQFLGWNGSLWVPTSIAVPVPATTVTGPDAFGASAVVGMSALYARQDHDHGLPANPVTLAAVTALNVPGTILATKNYGGAGSTPYTVAATTITVLDATNLTLAFTVPANGIVDVVVSLFYFVTITTNACELQIALFNHTGAALIGSPVTAADNQAVNTTVLANTSFKFHLTGLTPGALQVDLAAGRTNATGNVCGIYAGTNSSKTVASNTGNGPVVMQAIASV